MNEQETTNLDAAQATEVFLVIAALTERLVRLTRNGQEFGSALTSAIITDLTKIADAATRLEALVAAIAEGTSEKDVSVVRHELRTPLNHVLGYGEMVLEDLPLEHTQLREVLQSAHEVSRQLLDRIGTLNQLPDRPIRLQAHAPSPAPTGTVSAANTVQQEVTDEGQALILVVDDIEMNRDVLGRRLQRLGHKVVEAEDGLRALELLTQHSFDLVLLDIMMPGMDGREVLQRIKSDRDLRNIPVIMISALSEMESVVRCIEQGAEDYLPKPFDPVILNARIGACLEKKRFHDQQQHYRRQIEDYNLRLEARVQEQVQEISRAQLGTIFALSKLAESRDPETGAHLERMREYSKLIAEQLRKLECYSHIIDDQYIRDIYAASPLHDVGKVGVPDHILQKPGRLTDDEFAIMKNHTLIGAETLKVVDEKHPGNTLILIGIEIAAGHHERWDGTGYPYGLSGAQIPLSARIVALADVYDALRSKRSYKDEFSHEKSRGIILEGNGKHFDPDVVDCFLAMEDEFERVWRALSD